MGKTQSRDLNIQNDDKRAAFISLKMVRTENSGLFGSFAYYTFTIRYRRFCWEVDLRYNELLKLERRLLSENPEQMASIPKLPRHNKIFWQHDKVFLMERAKVITKYLQDVLDKEDGMRWDPLLQALGASCVSFTPELGRKGREGYLKKSSGGYKEKFSRKAGDYFQVWSWRWFVLQDNCILWFKNPQDNTPQGSLQIDKDFSVTMIKRVIRVSTGTRNLVLYAPTQRLADSWAREIKDFYAQSSRVVHHPFGSSFAPRQNCEVRAYTVTKDYMHAVALAILGAQKEILITSWKMSPSVLLTRPPLPPLRLDQLLKYKADQGVNIYVLLYKEVEHIGQGNDSMKVQQKLESLSPNIHCIRHPNKFFGGATAVLWSHHEKIVIIDRNVVFVGGVDMAFQRYDNEKHLLADEDGILFPGHDYRQPAPGKHKPVRSEADAEQIKAMEDEEFIEVELAVVDENLPEAMITTDMEDEPYEVEVVVDFSLPENSLPPPPSQVMQPQAHASNRPDATVAASSSSRSEGKEEGKDNAAFPDGDIPDNISEASINWAEDRFVAMTPEERAAAVSPKSQTARNSILSEVKESFTTAAANVSTTLSFFTETASSMISNYTNAQATTKKMKSLAVLESRELYPRMGWHDIQCAISGRVARDISSHFVQRWNHHRLSTSTHNQQPILHDITDDVHFTVCARCGKTGIHEATVTCTCGYDLGPPNSYSVPQSILRTPTDPSRYSHMVFECQFDGTSKLPFRMEGDCPVVVTMLLPSAFDPQGNLEKEGAMLDLSGPMAEWLHAVGLRPSIGDVIFSIDGDVVTHLNSLQLRRLLAKKRRRAKTEGSGDSDCIPMLAVVFRRHYLEDLHEHMLKGQQHGFMALSPEQEAAAANQPLALKMGLKGGPQGTLLAAPGPAMPVNGALVESAILMEPVEEDDPAKRKIAAHDAAPSCPEPAMAIVDGAELQMEAAPAECVEMEGGALEAPEVVAVNSSAQRVDEFHPACLAAAQMEIQFSISRLFHEHARSVEQVPRIIDESGSCVVQALRSVGKWSVGTNVEASILRCYIETIQNAHHFIYIENQFFVGSLAGEGVQNGIPLALAERILKAHSAGQPFKVIIIIPLHPNGDMVNAMKAKVVMHYEYLTINRGVNSLFRMLRAKAPAINIGEYISFFSLRNWGVINNKVVTEQVYIHDKLMIVDDRIVIIGSANINDRSMLGARDSEIAVRIEDTMHIESTFGGRPFTVGYFPFMLRNKLMKQHVADESIDFSDPLKPEVYQQWMGISQKNSSVYDEIDGNISVYRCLTVNSYKQALEQYAHRSILDESVQMSLSEVRGFLVDWPQSLFRNEDLGPSLATRALIPDELWV